MPLPSGFNQLDNGVHIKPDGTGPFTAEGGGAADWFQKAEFGFWFKRDGSGPYFRDVVSGVIRPICPIAS